MQACRTSAIALVSTLLVSCAGSGNEASTTVPPAPTGITATGGSGQVTLSWTAVSGATSYNLYWSTAAGVTPVNGNRLTGVTSAFAQTGLLAGATYYYVLTAVNSLGESAASSQVSATTNAPTLPPSAPMPLTATGGDGQVTISFAAVTGATSYNIYWSTTTGVTTANGFRIPLVNSPYVQTGLGNDTTYYYVVTAVNSAGESAASSQVSTTTEVPSSPPAAPTGVTATGGNGQVTISFAAVSGATSYNIYWSATAGLTTADGNRLTAVTSPFVQTGLLAGTTYYYVVTAVNSIGESVASPQVNTSTQVASSPPSAPTGAAATGGDGQVTISFTAVTGATSYNIYWSTTTGVTTLNGNRITAVTSPCVQTGLNNGTTYYYVVTAVNSAGESAASSQASASTQAPSYPPSAPTGVTASGGNEQVTLSWNSASGATSYNVYWSTTTGVTTVIGNRLTGVTSPCVQTGLDDGITYYYVVTAVNSVGESVASPQVSATTEVPGSPPAAPTGVTATGGNGQVTISWSVVSGPTSYNIYWATTTGVTTANGNRLTGVTSPFVQPGLLAGTTYYYVVTAVNSIGESAASSQVSATSQVATFTYSGNVQPWTVPAGVTSVTIECWGAQGGGTWGGNGGYAKGSLAVSGGQTLNIYVGGLPSFPCGFGGWNGGGYGGSVGYGGCGWGGGGGGGIPIPGAGGGGGGGWYGGGGGGDGNGDGGGGGGGGGGSSYVGGVTPDPTTPMLAGINVGNGKVVISW